MCCLEYEQPVAVAPALQWCFPPSSNKGATSWQIRKLPMCALQWILNLVRNQSARSWLNKKPQTKQRKILKIWLCVCNLVVHEFHGRPWSIYETMANWYWTLLLKILCTQKQLRNLFQLDSLWTWCKPSKYLTNHMILFFSIFTNGTCT